MMYKYMASHLITTCFPQATCKCVRPQATADSEEGRLHSKHFPSKFPENHMSKSQHTAEQCKLQILLNNKEFIMQCLVLVCKQSTELSHATSVKTLLCVRAHALNYFIHKFITTKQLLSSGLQMNEMFEMNEINKCKNVNMKCLK